MNGYERKIPAMIMHNRVKIEGFRSVKHFVDLSKYNRRTLNHYYNDNKPLFEAILTATKRKLQ